MHKRRSLRTRYGWLGFALLVLAAPLALAACGGGTSAPSNPLAVVALRTPLTDSRRSPVAHDTEVVALAAHGDRLFAATDQWQYGGRSASGQVLVKNSASSQWQLFEQTDSTRVQAIDSFAIPADQGMGAGHSLLVTQAIVHGRSQIQWLLDGARTFTPANSFTLSSNAAVRSFGAHESGGVWAVYAGVSPTGIMRGVWSPTRHMLVFDRKPELVAASPGSVGLKTQKVTGFADCAGALYVSINTGLYRRNDGPLPSVGSRWTLIYREPPVGLFNSGLRGLTCITHDGAPALLVSTEGSGNVYRFDHLPHGVLGRPRQLVPTREFSPISAIRRMLASEGTTVPASGNRSIDYVIAAYNNFTTVDVDGASPQLFGFEWGYKGACATGRRCGPTAFGLEHFDAAACFAARTDRGGAPQYSLRCLSGSDFTPVGKVTRPIRGGQAFVSIRTIQPSPFGDGRLFYGGYDCNFYPADGTAWVASSAGDALHLNDTKAVKQ